MSPSGTLQTFALLRLFTCALNLPTVEHEAQATVAMDFAMRDEPYREGKSRLRLH
jgi:hypothetical protein